MFINTNTKVKKSGYYVTEETAGWEGAKAKQEPHVTSGKGYTSLPANV